VSGAGTPAKRGVAVRVGVISDTHGLVRESALAALRGVAHVVHAGDVGSPEVLEALAAIAPVTAVRGNNDRGAWARRLPERATLDVGGARILVVHDRHELDADEAAGFDVVVSGHSHRPGAERVGGALYLNPGSAGPRRFTLPISLARLSIAGGAVRCRLVTLDVG
jgi:putative phosphoesterase